MKMMPLTIGTIHFVGIGGIGMSGIAEVMHNLGYSVQGSDLAENANVGRLRGLGVAIAIGHDVANLGEAEVVVVSSAVDTNNPEVDAARRQLIPIVRRAEMLAELMRLKWAIAVGGTHGKTTTTSIIAAMLDAGRYDPTVINGGIINAYGTNARLGAGEWMVVAADESDGTFVKLPATVAVVTNIDPEHMNFYGSFDALRGAFQTFVENIPFYGFAALCIDHPEVQAMIGRITDRRVVTYGLSPQAEFRATDLRFDSGGSVFNVDVTNRGQGENRILMDMRLPMIGAHNVQNSLAALVVAREMGIPDEVARRALRSFKGVKRRFTKTGESRGIVVIDDYAHHPVEVEAVLRAARSASSGRILAVVQPHRYSRLRDLFEEFCSCFNGADTVIVANVHAAGEAPIEGIDRDHLVAGLQARGHRHVETLISPAHLAPLVHGLARSGDLVVCLGAGSVTKWAHALPAELDALDDGARARTEAGQ